MSARIAAAPQKKLATCLFASQQPTQPKKRQRLLPSEPSRPTLTIKTAHSSSQIDSDWGWFVAADNFDGGHRSDNFSEAMSAPPLRRTSSMTGLSPQSQTADLASRTQHTHTRVPVTPIESPPCGQLGTGSSNHSPVPPSATANNNWCPPNPWHTQSGFVIGTKGEIKATDPKSVPVSPVVSAGNSRNTSPVWQGSDMCGSTGTDWTSRTVLEGPGASLASKACDGLIFNAAFVYNRDVGLSYKQAVTNGQIVIRR